MAADTDHRESRNKYGNKHGYLVFFVMCFLMGSTALTESIKPTSKVGSWWKGRARCKEEFNSDLYILENMYNTSNLTPSSYYWVGALETSQWKWTDNSPLFRYMGYLTNNRRRVFFNLPGNSVLQCYESCYYKTYFGLSGTRCYCFDGSEEFDVVSRAANEYSCPGNPDEQCGNANGISVFRTDIHQWIDLGGNCAYAFLAYDWGQRRYYPRLKSGGCNVHSYKVCSSEMFQDGDWNCNTNGAMYYSCRDYICVACGWSSWPSANKSCNLVKMTNENKEKIGKVLSKNINYWIGLYKLSRKIWINGGEIDSTYRDDDTSNPKCLALWYNGYSLVPQWTSCHWNNRALCVDHNPATEKSLATEKVTGRRPPSTTESSSELDLSKTGGNLPSATANNALTTTDRPQEREKMIDGTTNSNNNQGLYIYISTGGGVLVLAVLITALIMKRREMLCFRKEQRRVVRFQAGTENLTYVSNPQERDLAPSYMSVQPAGQAAYAPGDPNKPDSVSDLYSQVNKPQRKNTKVEVEHVNIETGNPDLNKGLDDQDVYNRAGANSRPVDVENCYNHLNTDGEDDYDIAGRQPDIDQWDSTYNHLGAIGVDKTESNGQEQEEDQHYYNVESIVTRK